MIQQLPQYNTIPLSFLNSDYTGYTPPVKTGKFGSVYLYFGIVPRSYISRGTLQGYTANDKIVQISNSDGNPNCYFAFYPILDGSSSKYIEAGGNIFQKWLDGSTVSITELPDEFFMILEEHQGGGGTLGTTADVALGIRFIYSSKYQGICYICEVNGSITF